MKKKILTVAMACALGAACLLGAAGCNNGNEGENSVPSTVVTEEEWKEAFKKTREATNYTAKRLYNLDESGAAKMVPDLSEEEIERLKFTRSEHSEEIYSVTDNCFNLEVTFNRVNNEVSEDGVLKRCGEKIDEDWYCAGYSDNDWKEVWGPYHIDYFMSEIKVITYERFCTTADAFESKDLENLYSSFSYDDGAYTAKLYELPTDNAPENPIVHQIKIKINSEGYVCYYSNIEEDYRESATYRTSHKFSVTISISDYGKAMAETNAEARQAIDKYIADNKAN